MSLLRDWYDNEFSPRDLAPDTLEYQRVLQEIEGIRECLKKKLSPEDAEQLDDLDFRYHLKLCESGYTNFTCGLRLAVVLFSEAVSKLS